MSFAHRVVGRCATRSAVLDQTTRLSARWTKMPPSRQNLSGFQVLTANREKIDQEAMKERNALYWPISALRVLLKAKNNPEVRILRPSEG